eukprot:TRINITY_DN3303_c0_g1_i4.p1 TRINITY_DN3303_c0_g1~~TRINITY_DN3303_c0_g1_i4.p1  ORF type:complete len:1007 (+),score=286.82 TRINITY_DN3303_c0_g1_i4:101-3121(+)
MPAHGAIAAAVVLWAGSVRATIEWGDATDGASVPVCADEGEYFDLRAMKCSRCPFPSVQEVDMTGRGCRCRLGYSRTGADPYSTFLPNATDSGAEPADPEQQDWFREDAAAFCQACPEGTSSDSQRLTCIACGESTLGYNAVSKRCECAAGHALVHFVNGTRLEEAVCVDCARYSAEYEVVVLEDGVEQACALADACPSAAGLTLFEGTCLPEAELKEVGTSPGDLLRYDDGSTFKSERLERDAIIAAAKCLAGLQGAGGCEALANLCALQVYDRTQGACKLYWQHLTEVEECMQPLCDQPAYLPWLYYQAPAEDVLRVPLQRNVMFGDSLRMVVNVYSLDGTLLRTTELLDELFLCDVPDPVSEHAFRFGNNVKTHCSINPAWLADENSPEPLFFDLFIATGIGARSNTTFHPVPIRVYDERADDSVFYASQRDIRVGSAGVSETQLYRRMALYDNVLSDRYVRYARDVSILVALVPGESGMIYAPLVTVQYDYIVRGEARSPPSSLAFVPKTLLKGPTVSRFAVFYVMRQDRRALLAFIITSCCVALFSSLAKAWGWMRRGNSPMVDVFGLLVRWFVYYCSHLSTCFFCVLMGTCFWYFFWFKGQQEASVLLPTPSAMHDYLSALLWTAFACRFIDVTYRVYEQCTMWVFFLDWEQPRGKLPTENSDVPVSMWRMVFASNAFNQLQSQLTFKLYATLILVVLLLEPVGLLGLTTAQPNGDDLSLEGSYSHPILRIGLSVLIWYGLMVVLWIYEVGVYHRFFAEDTVCELVNLLSLSNVSMFCLLERRWGYYIHGKSVHQFCEANVREFQEMLRREELGAIPMRGLTGQSDAQTYELVVDDALERQLWSISQAERVPTQTTRPKRCYEYFMGRSDRMLLSAQCLLVLQDLNRYLQSTVTKNADEVRVPSQVHRALGAPPAALQAVPTSFYLADDRAWYRVTLYYLEFALSNLALLFFIALDYRFDNIFASMSAAFVLVYGIQVVRRVCGSTNLARKTLLDDRFFL